MADFEAPESRNEALLQNILGAENEITQPQSRNEAILYAILNNLEEIPEPYEAPPRGRIEPLLLELKTNLDTAAQAIADQMMEELEYKEY